MECGLREIRSRIRIQKIGIHFLRLQQLRDWLWNEVVCSMGTSFDLLECELGRGLCVPQPGNRLCRMDFWWDCKIDFWWELAFGAMPRLLQVELYLVPPFVVDPLLRLDLGLSLVTVWLGLEGWILVLNWDWDYCRYEFVLHSDVGDKFLDSVAV